MLKVSLFSGKIRALNVTMTSSSQERPCCKWSAWTRTLSAGFQIP